MSFLVLPERDGEGVWFTFSLSDEERSISWNPEQVILGLPSAQITVEPPAKDKQEHMSSVSGGLWESRIFSVERLQAKKNRPFGFSLVYKTVNRKVEGGMARLLIYESKIVTVKVKITCDGKKEVWY